MSFDINDFKKFLEDEFAKRKSKNPSYSKRAFAKMLGVNQSSLSKFFNGKRKFCQKTIEKCLEKLK